MLTKIIDNSGIFIDILVPEEHSQTFIDSLKEHKGCQLDDSNCYLSDRGYQIRILCRVLGQGSVFQLIRDIAEKCGLDTT